MANSRSHLRIPDFGPLTKHEQKNLNKLGQTVRLSSPGAQPTQTKKPAAAQTNPFTGKTMAEMKKMWAKMTPDQRKANVINFRKAAKQAPKAKPVPKASKPAVTKKPTTTNTRKNRQGGSTGGRGAAPSGAKGSNVRSNPTLKSQSKKNLTPRQRIKLEVNAATGGGSSHTRSKTKPKVTRNRRGRAV